MFKVKVLFNDGDIEWYIVSAYTSKDAESIVCEMLDWSGIEAISAQCISPYHIYCITEEIFNELDYNDKSGSLKDN